MAAVRISPQTVQVLEEMMNQPGEQIHGFDLMRATRLKSGTIYPILARLEGAGWLESDWEATPSHGGPRRRFYKLTAVGVQSARLSLAEWRERARTVERGRVPGRPVTT